MSSDPIRALAALKRAFSYVFDEAPMTGGGRPQLELHEIDGPFDAAGIRFEPIPESCDSE